MTSSGAQRRLRITYLWFVLRPVLFLVRRLSNPFYLPLVCLAARPDVTLPLVPRLRTTTPLVRLAARALPPLLLGHRLCVTYLRSVSRLVAIDNKSPFFSRLSLSVSSKLLYLILEL